MNGRIVQFEFALTMTGISAAPRRHLGDISQVLAELGAQLHAEIDFNNCVWHPKMCRQRLKVRQGPDLGQISARSRRHLGGIS